MKSEVVNFLSANDNWKLFINDNRDLKGAILLKADVLTIQQEENKVNFDVSIIYTAQGRQEQVLKSGRATINNMGEIDKLYGDIK
jgi:hypothetical protein